MANEISSKVIVLEVNNGTIETPDWVKLVCLTEKTFNGTTNNNEIITDCDDDWIRNLSGKRNWSIDFSGFANSTPEAGEGSYEETASLWASGETKYFRLRNSDNSYYREGQGYINSLSEGTQAGQYLNFNGTIQGSGQVSFVPVS